VFGPGTLVALSHASFLLLLKPAFKETRALKAGFISFDHQPEFLCDPMLHPLTPGHGKYAVSSQIQVPEAMASSQVRPGWIFSTCPFGVFDRSLAEIPA
jgi:hypothetical protein